MCGQKAIWEIIGCEFLTQIIKTSRVFNKNSNKMGVIDWEFGLVSGGAVI